MKTVAEVSRLTGVSVRTLHHYDAIGLLKPAEVTEAGYRLYDEAALERLFQILVYRELGFSLKEIQDLLDAPDYDRNRTLDRQTALLRAKVTHLQEQIQFANSIKQIGVNQMDWKKFDPRKIDDYSAQAQTLYGKTEAYQEYKQKSKNRSRDQEMGLGGQVMDFFAELGQLRHLSPESEEVQAWVSRLQAFFTEHYYNCTPQILLGLSQMYAAGGSMTDNIDAAGGPGTGEFARKAIEVYCSK